MSVRANVLAQEEAAIVWGGNHDVQTPGLSAMRRQGLLKVLGYI